MIHAKRWGPGVELERVTDPRFFKLYIWVVEPKIGDFTPKMDGFSLETSIKMDDLETPI